MIGWVVLAMSFMFVHFHRVAVAVLAVRVVPGGRPAAQPGLTRGVWRAALTSGPLLRCCLASAVLTGPYFGFAAVWSVPYLRTVVGLDLASAAGLSTFLALGLLGGALLLGAVADRVFRSALRPLVLCAALSPAVWLLRAVWPAGLAPWLLVPVLLGAGLVCASFVLLTAAAKELGPPGAVGTIAGLLNAASYMGAAALQLLFGAVLDAAGRADALSFRLALLAYAVVAVIGVLAALGLLRSARA
jgi:sugar phosphate permease